ncbi:MAG: phospho-sugar mutase [Bacilli bacterium]|jgi:phosphoglucomutase|nr:phospho-sugar mutase [Bacilli bacterium]MDD4005576.1 phospho-sugar mutase [Bacilli bacterium]
MVTKQNYNRWLQSPKVSSKMKEEMKRMSPQEIDESFFKDIEFGTAGMRGVIGPGTNRMNYFTIQKAAVGFALYLLSTFANAQELGVVISHDNRHMSREFTVQIANLFSEMGIKCYIFDSLRPTPELSFAVRYKKACGGIMITASHNPKEYNGFKVYDEHGCQLVPNKINKLIKIIDNLPNELDLVISNSSKKGLIKTLDSDVDDEYVRLVKQIQLNPNLPKEGFKIVFTPNHGTSYVNAMRVFKDCGYEIYPVLSQVEPDPDFKGTLSPNPEDKNSYIEPIKLAKEIGAQFIVMTDPDGDRVGVSYLSSNGEYELFTGNQSAALLIDYVLGQRAKYGLLAKNGVFYDTIVSSDLGRTIAKNYGLRVETFLTGFKFIGDRIQYYLENDGPTFEFGYEESYGCLISPFARDKDGIQAILMYCEMALYHYLQGKTLDVVYDDIQKKYGYRLDISFSVAFKGSAGMLKMREIMTKLSNQEVKSLNGHRVIEMRDYMKSVIINERGNEQIALPSADVVTLILDDETSITVRPSGTEPKCKFYFGVKGLSAEAIKNIPNLLFAELKEKLDI